MQPKRCADCVYWEGGWCLKLKIATHTTFYCAYWVRKPIKEKPLHVIQ